MFSALCSAVPAGDAGHGINLLVRNRIINRVPPCATCRIEASVTSLLFVRDRELSDYREGFGKMSAGQPLNVRWTFRTYVGLVSSAPSGSFLSSGTFERSITFHLPFAR
jgi:hypothetical protein